MFRQFDYFKKALDFWSTISYNIITVKENLTSQAAGAGKEIRMNEEMNTGELLVQVTEENQTRKILEILNGCKDLEEAKEKVKALLDK